MCVSGSTTFVIYCAEGDPMHALGRGLRFHVTAVGWGFLALISSAQTLSPGEVSIRSWPYSPPLPQLRVRTNEVQAGVVVRDSKGQVVSGLTQRDFAIYDDGKQQFLSSFSVEHRQVFDASGAVAPPASAQPNAQPSAPARPRYVALYFDDLNTEFGEMRHVQLAAENFLRTGIGPDDKIALFTSSGLQTVSFTPNAPEIISAVEELKFHGRAIKSSGCPRITPYDAYVISTEPNPPITDLGNIVGSPTYQAVLGEAIKCNCVDTGNFGDGGTCATNQRQVIVVESQQIWDSVRQMSQDTLNSLQAAVDCLADRPGERILVLASSGFLAGTLEDKVDSILNDALHADIVINSLDAKGLLTYTETEDRNDGAYQAVYRAQSFGQSMMTLTAAMVDFAVGTGGRFFHNRNDLAAGYYALAAAPETEYLLGFVPGKEEFNAKFHKLKVTVSAPGKFTVQARPGYFAPSKEAQEQASQPTAEEQIDAEVRSSQQHSDFPITVSEKPSTANGARKLNVQTHVDIQKLPFELQNNRHVDMLTFVAALFDAQGKMIAGKEAQMELALKPETFERFAKSGIDGGMSLEAPPGAYRLPVVVEEALRGEMSAMSRNVQIQ
ncbi:MAG TPA: VWA domain-containing protein [Candidatus Acidoferrales bacterium]|nr:VWA domain-containing protein [Candidatus Acidoferrales bacterium]